MVLNAQERLLVVDEVLNGKKKHLDLHQTTITTEAALGKTFHTVAVAPLVEDAKDVNHE